jgi:UDP-N-acetylglucosamine--dolichyl-phosphate N-acetylglucosaminephosphotransferase
MLFLGFTDDVLDWPWRYKLVLPTIASLPLLCCYEGSTSIVVPIQLRPLLWKDGEGTLLGNLLNTVMVVDAQAHGAVIETGVWYLLYMGMLAVFCTNAINIYAGINGLEAGQSYVIGCAVLVHNLLEIEAGNLATNHLFSAMIMLSFVGVTLGLLRHNWYPASRFATAMTSCAGPFSHSFSLRLGVFVGDTFCYFSGMTFAVVGILGHFSKTLLLFFLPQILNFLWSCPQLFRFVPCPRHRLPRLNPATGLLEASTFSCRADQFCALKRKANDTKCPNMTLICLCLQWCGPQRERDLCVILLVLQALSCAFGLTCRYSVAQFFFES